MKTKHLWFFIIIYIFLFIFLFPGYRYLMDADATGYLSVAEKIADGNYLKSVNGIWSPLGSWILVPFIKGGGNAILFAKYLNGFYGLISLILFFHIIRTLKIYFLPAVLIMGAGVLLLLHFSFARLFADNLLVMILLCYVSIVQSNGFVNNYKKIIAAGFLGALAFYAKAYSFYFILLHLPIVIIYFEKQITGFYFSKSGLKKIITGIAVLVIASSFWFIALHNKYGHFILGQKNVTGTLTELYKPTKKLIYPPANGDYAFFDDISSVNANELTPLDNVSLLFIQFKLILNNALLFISTLNEFSVFLWMIIFISVMLKFYRKKIFFFNLNITPLLIFIILWPTGFLLFSIQNRFFWVIDLVILCLCGVLLTKLIQSSFLSKNLQIASCSLIILSFYIYPLMELKKDYGKDKNLFEITEKLKRNNINGKVIAGIQSDNNLSNSIIINYLNASKLYGTYTRNYSTAEILQAIKDYSIQYYFFYYATTIEKESFLESELSKKAIIIYKDIYPGIIVLKFTE